MQNGEDRGRQEGTTERTGEVTGRTWSADSRQETADSRQQIADSSDGRESLEGVLVSS
jgi:hypothetical protein